MNKIKNLLRKSRPDRVDAGYAALAAGVLMILTNLAKIMDGYNVAGSRQLLQSTLGRNITDFLARIDDFRLTKTVVLFLFWSFVGLVAYLFTQSLLAARSRVKYDAEVSSASYVHPESFNKQVYWRGVVQSRVVLLILLGILLAALSGYLASGLPFANQRLAAMVDTYTPSAALQTFVGFFVLFVWGGLVIFCLKLLRNRTTLLS